MNFKKLMVSFLAGVALMTVTATAFAASEKIGGVTASGSSAILPLAKVAAEEYMMQNPYVKVNITAGGSFTGLKEVEEGSVDIGNSDVPAEGEQYKDLVGHKVAVAPFVIITHPSNPVSNLTQAQLINIFTGKITNWKEVGGSNQAITIIGRAKTSGSRATIKRIVLNNQEFTDNAVIQDSTGALRTGVSTTEGSIGYVDAAYVNSSVKALKYNGVQFTDANVINGKYPIWTYEYMYTKGQPKVFAKEVIDFILESSFQNTFVDKLGFIPMNKMAGKVAQTETKAPVTKKPVVKKPVVIKRAIGSTYTVDGRVWKVGKDGKSYFVKLAARVKGSTYIKNGRVWKVGADNKDYYVKQAK